MFSAGTTLLLVGDIVLAKIPHKPDRQGRRRHNYITALRAADADPNFVAALLRSSTLRGGALAHESVPLSDTQNCLSVGIV